MLMIEYSYALRLKRHITQTADVILWEVVPLHS